MRPGRAVLVIACCAILAAAACSSSAPAAAHPQTDDAITVGAFNFDESRLLGEVYAQALEGAGYRVVRAFDLGTRELVEPSLERGLVELVPEYGGSLLAFLTGRPSSSDEAAVHRSLVRTLAPRGITVLDASPAQDRNVVVVTAPTAARWHLRTTSDLQPVADRLSLGGPPECPDRPLCLQGLADVYGLSFRSFVPLDESGPVTAGALLAGQVQAAVMFSSDGTIRQNGLVPLRDDRALQPAENVTPVVRSAVLDRLGPDVARVADAVSAALTTDGLRALNEAVSIHRRSPRVVAAAWLAANGLDAGVR
jgi:osmoprotectant transport system substrate-binding protein